MEATAAHTMKYRPDIDGLRALAILPVMLYHAKLGCPGGFVGVDVFFVISGYLITSLILDELAGGTFSLIHFWERRIRRILPMAGVVMAATMVAASFWYLPGDFALIGKSAAAQAVFAGNFFFWKQSGYFAPNWDTKPLLHTWSLAVEEQFYLLFPPLIVLLARFKNNTVIKAMAGLALASLALSIAGANSKHFQSQTFYLLPGRAWELLLGALLAALRGRIGDGGALREISGWLGIGLIAWPVFYFSEATVFPGLGAFPPCLGTAMVIFSSERKLSAAGQVLAMRPLVFIGLISYSLYLWHWPLLSFAAYSSKDLPETAVRMGLLGASFILAMLSWQWIEKPFRQRQILQERRHIFAFAAVSLMTLLAPGLAVGLFNGFPSRLPDAVTIYADARYHKTWIGETDMGGTWEKHVARFSETQPNRPVDVLIWGDSHAMSLVPVIDELCQRKGWLDMEATRSGTPPVLGGYSLKGYGEVPSVFSDTAFRYVTACHPRVVILAAKWSGYTASDRFKSNLVATVRALADLGVKVYTVKDVPFPGFNAPRFAALTAMHHGDIHLLGVTSGEYEKMNNELEPAYAQITSLGDPVLDPAPFFLNTNGLYGVEKGGRILYFDPDHLTVDGSMLLMPMFEPIFQTK
jgi:peptidoglycan/LPS O-acetylase OafA/YrhL